jgi:hypothetical protein
MQSGSLIQELLCGQLVSVRCPRMGTAAGNLILPQMPCSHPRMLGRHLPFSGSSFIQVNTLRAWITHGRPPGDGGATADEPTTPGTRRAVGPRAAHKPAAKTQSGGRRGARSGRSGTDSPAARPTTLDLPALAAQPGAGLHPSPSDPRGDVPAAQCPPAARVVGALIAMQLGRSPARPTRSAPWPNDGRDRVYQLHQQQRVVGAGRRQPHRQRSQWRRSAGGTWNPACPGSTGFAPVNSPQAAPDTDRVDGRPRPVDLVVVTQPVQQPVMQLLPDTAGLPVPQSPPAGHAAATAQLPSGQQPSQYAPW